VCEYLTIFQGTPNHYVDLPNYQRAIPEGERWCFGNVPFYERWYRFQHLLHLTDIYHESLTAGSPLNGELKQSIQDWMIGKCGDDRELLKKILPNYPPVCTRMLVDNGWIDRLKRPNVTIVDGHATYLTESSVVGTGAVEGQVIADVDAVVYCTGFQSTRFCLPAMKVTGKGGKTLSEVWGDVPTAYLGIIVPQFPNFFVTYGPNTSVGSVGSIMWNAENEARYIMQCCTAMVRNNIRSLECKQEVAALYDKKLCHDLKSTVWSDPGCRSWYKNGAEGKPVTNCPYSLEDYWESARALNLDDYDCVRA
ncbi:unnamed protein product, partial [Polarella glacialis]